MVPRDEGEKGMRCGRREGAGQIRSCPRNCERLVSSGKATGAALRPGRQDEAPIREPGDLPSNRVDATNTGRGVPVDDPKGASLLVLARADGRSREDRFC